MYLQTEIWLFVNWYPSYFTAKIYFYTPYQFFFIIVHLDIIGHFLTSLYMFELSHNSYRIESNTCFWMYETLHIKFILDINTTLR